MWQEATNDCHTQKRLLDAAPFTIYDRAIQLAVRRLNLAGEGLTTGPRSTAKMLKYLLQTLGNNFFLKCSDIGFCCTPAPTQVYLRICKCIKQNLELVHSFTTYSIE